MREFLTGIGGPPADTERLRTAAWVRLLVIVPTFFVPTFLAFRSQLETSHQPEISRLIFSVWILLALVYPAANGVILLSHGRNERLERALTFVCMLLEVSTNHLLLYSIGTLTSHAIINTVVVIAIYRVFFDYTLGLSATVAAAGMLALTVSGQAADLLPIAPLLSAPLPHDINEPAAAAVALGVVLSGLLVAFAAINFGMNQTLKLHRYITESVLMRYLPPSMVVQASRGALRLDAPPDRRVVTVMFTDIVGFTSLCERIGPEALGELLNGYLAHMSAIAHRHGATVDKFVGDAIMIVFGAPEPLEPREQAIRCVELALEIQAAVPDIGEKLELQARTGINTGEAVVGNFGSEVRSDYTVVGPAVNVAARLESASRPGCILVGPQTARLLGDRFLLEPAGELKLKGVGGPVAASFVKAHRDTRSKGERETAEAPAEAAGKP